MLQNLPIMLFGISLIFCLLCLFLCFLDTDYADISYFKLCNFAENNHDRNEIDLHRITKAFAALCLQNLHIPTACLAYYLTCTLAVHTMCSHQSSV